MLIAITLFSNHMSLQVHGAPQLTYVFSVMGGRLLD